MILILLIIQLRRTEDLHLTKALFSLDPDNLQLHYFLGLGELCCCSFFCSLYQPLKTFDSGKLENKNRTFARPRWDLNP